MNLKYYGTLLAFLMLSVFTVAAEEETEIEKKKKTDTHITGHVIDAETGEHLPYVTVSVKGTNIGVMTDATGHFLLKNLPLGNHTIVGSFVGYTKIEKEISLITGKTIEIELILEPQILEVDAVVVTGNRNETDKRHSATIVNVVSDKLFEKTTSNTVAEVLNYQSGLRVEYSCSNCGVPQLRINGLEGQYSQILLDSRPIFSSLATVYGLEQLPAGMIERIEVIRGGGSALFGSNAIGGVVNIITKDPLRNSLTVSNNTGIYQGGGSDINTTLNGSFVTDDYKAGIYIFGMIRDREQYDRDSDGFSEIPKLQSETIGFRSYYKLTPSSRLTAEYHRISEFRRGGNKMNLPAHEADIAEQLRHKINGGGLKYDFLTSDYKHHLSIYTSLQNIDRESYFGTEQNLDAYGTTKDLTLIAGAQYDYRFNKILFSPSVLTVGAEYTNNMLTDKMLGYDRILDQHSISYGAFMQNEWQSDKFNLLIGARLDKHNKVDNPILSPRVNVRYTPSNIIGLRASYSSGYRAPQAYDEDLHVAAVGGEVAIITIDPDLKPEYSQSFSASADLYRRFGHIEGNLLLEGFYTDLNDVFMLAEKGKDPQGNLLLERRNASGAIVKGVNMELKIGFTSKLTLDGGFTIQSSRYKEAEQWSENGNIAPQKKMFRSPDQYGYLTLSYKPIKAFMASLSGNYTGPMIVQHYAGFIAEDKEVTTPSFWDMGLRFSYDFKLSPQTKLQISCGVKNFLDSFQKDIDQGIMRDAGYIYGPAAPRTYHFGVKITM